VRLSNINVQDFIKKGFGVDMIRGVNRGKMMEKGE
jgi:hypothetical protein